MATYDSVRTLPLHIDGYYLEPLEREVARGFTLRRTVVVLHGRGEEGRGEEVDYDPAQQARFQEHGGELPLAGEHTLESFSLLQSGQTEYRRWALESAALDLALRQAGLSLGEAVGRTPQPLRFVVSTRVTAVRALARRSTPELRFKLDPGSDWTDEIVASLAATGSVETVDFKGIYPRRVRRAARRRALRAHRRRLPRRVDRGSRAHSRDLRGPRRAPRPHHVGRRDPRVERRRSAAVRTARLNCKPSRFGSVKRLFDFYDACERARDRALRRRPVRARARPRADPAARLALPSRTRRTTSRRTASTSPSRSPACLTSPLPVESAPGFRI